MARLIEKLSPAKVQKEKRPGMYGDGGGLWLHVGPTGGKSWIFRYMVNGKAREMGLGPLHTISLAEARVGAREQRKVCLAGLDPLAEREKVRTLLQYEAAKAVTFRACAARYIS